MLGKPELDRLLTLAGERYAAMTDVERQRMWWDQTVSWVYANLALDCRNITREHVIEAVTREKGPRP
jgi:hypothetical protein